MRAILVTVVISVLACKAAICRRLAAVSRSARRRSLRGQEPAHDLGWILATSRVAD